MGALTETEIFSCLAENFRLAAESCADLARLPAKGPSYRKLREQLQLLEGACRQAGFWRDDSRWFTIGRMMAEAHRRAGSWLRGYRRADGIKVSLRPDELHPLFAKLADNLRAGQKAAEDLRDKRTHRLGPIMPAPGRGPHRDTRPVGYSKAVSGLFIPAGHA